MEVTTSKQNLLGNILVRLLSFGVFVFLARFAYILTLTSKSCDSGEFCFFPSSTVGFIEPDTFSITGDGDTSAGYSPLRNYYSSVFQDLIADGYLSPESKSLCIETPTTQDVIALREIGVSDSIGIHRRSSSPLILSGRSIPLPFVDNTFDFEFSGTDGLDRSSKAVDFASEVSRTLKPGGFFVVHTGTKDVYSLDSLLDLFNSCRLIRSRRIGGLYPSIPPLREIVLKKDHEVLHHSDQKQHSNGNLVNKCFVPGYKRELIRNLEPLIIEEPLKPWITLKRNMKKIKYLPSMVDISFKRRYIYIDVGSRNYGSSIGSWFKKQYPKQNKSFEIYAIEADKSFHEEYRSKKKINLLPYAAWLRNETLFFEINREPSRINEEKGRGMGRIQAVQSSSNFVNDSDEIRGFDFANWLKNTVRERDFVVVKMDVEGTEFHLIPKLIESGGICLIDEMFLECHYNRCCNGERSSKYHKSYEQCLDLFSSLRGKGVFVHQWW